MIALLPADMEINRGVCSSSLSGSCEDQRYSAGNGSNCSVQVAILLVLWRLWRPLRLQPGVHCILPVRRSITRFLLRPTCRVHFDASWEVRNMEARSQEKLISVSNTMDSRDEVSHTVLILDCSDTLTTRSTWPAQGIWDTKVDNIKPQ